MISLSSFLLLTLLSSIFGTGTGFGTSTIMVPALSLFLPFSQALLFAGIVHWFGDIWKMIFFKKGLDFKLILLFGIPGVIISFFAGYLPIVIPESLLKRSLGLFLSLYVAFIFLRPNWKAKASSRNAITGGVLSGFFAGLFGAGGAVRSAFLAGFDLPKSVFIFTSGAIGLLIDTGRVSQYLLSGVRLNSQLSITLLLCLPVSLLGAYLAKILINYVPQKSFRALVSIGLLLVGIYYVLLPS